MRLGIDDILLAHGIGGQPGPYFGNGSDGAFNPAGPPAPTTITGDSITYPYQGYYTAVGNAYPSTANANVGVAPAYGLIFDGGGTTAPTVSPPIGSSPSNSNTAAAGSTSGTKFHVGQTQYIKGFTFATGTAMSNVTFTLWDTTTQMEVATITVASVLTGTNSYYFASSIQLIGGRDYILSAFGPSIYAYNISPAPPTSVNIPTYTSTPTSTYTFNTTQDGQALVKQFTSMYIPANLTVTVSNRCQGIVFLVQNDVTINGEICMDYMGALLDPTQNAGFTAATKIQQLYCPIGNNKFVVIGPGGSGGAGGNGGSVQNPALGGLPTGGTWWGGGRGGGGAGGNSNGGAGGNASYAGTSAGGATVSNTATTGGPGNPGTNGGGGSGSSTGEGNASYPAYSGAGGNGLGGGGGGGGSASMGSNYSGPLATAGSGTDSSQAAGGLILIICGGNLTINSGAKLSAKGGTGGNGGNALTGTNNSGFGGGGGGGGGGGIIALLYHGTYSNSGTTNVSGGAGGTGGTSTGANFSYGQPGCAGLPGIVQVVKLS